MNTKHRDRQPAPWYYNLFTFLPTENQHGSLLLGSALHTQTKPLAGGTDIFPSPCDAEAALRLARYGCSFLRQPACQLPVRDGGEYPECCVQRTCEDVHIALSCAIYGPAAADEEKFLPWGKTTVHHVFAFSPTELRFHDERNTSSRKLLRCCKILVRQESFEGTVVAHWRWRQFSPIMGHKQVSRQTGLSASCC
jgi:hypothetical protein